MRWIAVTLSLALSSSAYAGGLGIIATGGAHSERVFFYSSVDPEGNEYRNVDDYDQYEQRQLIPQGGLGLNMMIGDRDDKITGDARLYWSMDTPQVDPATLDAVVPDDAVVATVRTEPSHVGIMLLGLSWGLIGDPSKVQLAAIAHMGSAFITENHTEYLLLNAGPGITIRLARQAQLFGDVTYQMRYRKSFDHSVAGTLGVRYLFD